MKIESFPFQAISWTSVPLEEYKGETGTYYTQQLMMSDIRVRMIEYSTDFKADHWCTKGHVLLCLEGELDILLKDGRKMKLLKDMSLFIGDENEPHFISTAIGCKLFIVD